MIFSSVYIKHNTSRLNAALIPVSYLKAWLKSESLAEEQAAIITALEEHALLRYNTQEEVFSLHLEFQRILRSIAPVNTGPQTAHLLVNVKNEWDFENTNNWGETIKRATIWASPRRATCRGCWTDAAGWFREGFSS